MESAHDEKAVRDSFEADPDFQAALHVANAVHYHGLGYSAREAHDFLHQSIVLRQYRTNQQSPAFFQVVTQNVSIVKKVVQPFPA